MELLVGGEGEVEEEEERVGERGIGGDFFISVYERSYSQNWKCSFYFAIVTWDISWWLCLCAYIEENREEK